VTEINIQPGGRTYKMTPFLKLLVTPCLRTLDLIFIENGSYISDVLRLATIRSPVLREELNRFLIYVKVHFLN
jgi:hypothetical protein